MRDMCSRGKLFRLRFIRKMILLIVRCVKKVNLDYFVSVELLIDYTLV